MRPSDKELSMMLDSKIPFRARLAHRILTTENKAARTALRFLTQRFMRKKP